MRTITTIITCSYLLFSSAVSAQSCSQQVDNAITAQHQALELMREEAQKNLECRLEYDELWSGFVGYYWLSERKIKKLKRKLRKQKRRS